MPGTPWRLIIAVPDSRLFASISGWTPLISWLVFALVTVLGALLVALFARSLADRARLTALSATMRRTAQTDSLTGLYNRRALTEHLTRAAAHARRHDEPLSVLMIDLDRFKQTNDTFGHEAGDQVLCTIADCMRDVLRGDDVYGRWGGDEFLVALPVTDERGRRDDRTAPARGRRVGRPRRHRPVRRRRAEHRRGERRAHEPDRADPPGRPGAVPRQGARAPRRRGRTQLRARPASAKIATSAARKTLWCGEPKRDPPRAPRRRKRMSLLRDVALTLRPPPGDRHGPLVPMMVVLTLLTGLVDAASYLELGHVFVANMTGNIVFLGFAIAGASGLSAVASLLALASFLLGALGGGWLGSRNAAHRGRLLRAALATQAALILLALLLALLAREPLAEGSRYALIVVLALAMGVQNAAALRIAVPELTTTVLTRTLTGLASEATAVGGRGSHAGRRSVAVAAMLLGALAGGLLTLHVSVAATLAWRSRWAAPSRWPRTRCRARPPRGRAAERRLSALTR